MPSDFATARRSVMKEGSYSPGFGSSSLHGAEISTRVTPIDFISTAHFLNVGRSRHGVVQSHRSMLNSRGDDAAGAGAAPNATAPSASDAMKTRRPITAGSASE